MTQLARSPEVGVQHAAWLNLVRSACLTVSDKPASLITSTSLSKGFVPGDGEEREHCVRVAQRLAEEYGLRTTIEERGSFMTIRFMRQEIRAERSATTSGAGMVCRAWRRLWSKPRTDDPLELAHHRHEKAPV